MEEREPEERYFEYFRIVDEKQRDRMRPERAQKQDLFDRVVNLAWVFYVGSMVAVVATFIYNNL